MPPGGVENAIPAAPFSTSGFTVDISGQPLVLPVVVPPVKTSVPSPTWYLCTLPSKPYAYTNCRFGSIAAEPDVPSAVCWLDGCSDQITEPSFAAKATSVPFEVTTKIRSLVPEAVLTPLR